MGFGLMWVSDKSRTFGKITTPILLLPSCKISLPGIILNDWQKMKRVDIPIRIHPKVCSSCCFLTNVRRGCVTELIVRLATLELRESDDSPELFPVLPSGPVGLNDNFVKTLQ